MERKTLTMLPPVLLSRRSKSGIMFTSQFQETVCVVHVNHVDTEVQDLPKRFIIVLLVVDHDLERSCTRLI